MSNLKLLKRFSLVFVVKAFSRKLISLLSSPLNKYLRYRTLKDASFNVNFECEGDVSISLPKISLSKALLSKKGAEILNKSSEFSARPNHEKLLREIVFNLYSQGIIDKKKSIIDIGCWISDNAIVWAKNINSEFACVHAVDPSLDNLKFGELLKKVNSIDNIKFHHAVCTDTKNATLHYEGILDHAMFNQTGRGSLSRMKSTTLDSIIGKKCWNSIGLIHVDVEGMELQVLRGALKIIENSLPVILFEQHISYENPRDICAIFRPYSYTTYMINEVLPGCSLDCRNFISLPSELDISRLVNSSIKNNSIWPATVGNILIPIG